MSHNILEKQYLVTQTPVECSKDPDRCYYSHLDASFSLGQKISIELNRSEGVNGLTGWD